MELSKWDRRFLGLAAHVSAWSKDPSTQVGSVVTNDKRVVSLGFNGFPQGMSDDHRLHDRETKYSLVLHAEENALLFSGADLRGSTIYVYPLPPCSRCAAKIIQSGITRVVTTIPEEMSRWEESVALTRTIFEEVGIEMVEVPINLL
ncbi:MAG: dCMP deaminase family protein [Gammaproteobacteria bacterium]|jgi:dCMP deaminase|nr:dCMP deaminase family protein [Gammaproteobacteria bacterium]MBT4606361.1 dCMP deaminase family protein [Thiotrichales bacterium]MBT3472506.1 dCMP deaminase family protein [Gammaproteobacteria bacterium]MBT3967730.1 dCMP deaminase family protein [Gammaproteobacteria bacterium]MBT4081465.1 dCMP deaminase family protein [Gammaproteobacteria bacterium]